MEMSLRRGRLGKEKFDERRQELSDYHGFDNVLDIKNEDAK